MDFFRLMQFVKMHLKLSFDEIDRWFDKDNETLNFQPSNGGWVVSYEDVKEMMKKKKWTPPFEPRN